MCSHIARFSDHCVQTAFGSAMILVGDARESDECQADSDLGCL